MPSGQNDLEERLNFYKMDAKQRLRQLDATAVILELRETTFPRKWFQVERYIDQKQ